MMRSGFLGTQRYGIIPWTGDVSREWGGLQSQVELSLQMGLFGLAYTHSDLGGFAGGEVFDPELYIRWMQYGVFQPVYRPHAQDNIAPEPVFHDEKTKDIVREFVKLRYRLLPYNYSLSYENSLAGTPMMRPTFFNSASSAIDNKESYFWGDAFLVHPITSPNVASVDFALPPGVWFDYWNDKKWVNTAQNPKSIELATSLTTIPVMVKAGSFVPMTSNMQNTTEYDQSKLTLHYYHDASVKRASYTMYDDDGKSANAISEGNFQRLVFDSMLEGQQDNERLALSASVQGSFDGAPKRRHLTVVTHGVEDKPETIEVNGRGMKLLSAKAFVKAKEGAFWNEKTNQLRVKVQLETNLSISIQ
jgi:oligosaccharide 4-alpha-D-glucosyltransferase